MKEEPTMKESYVSMELGTKPILLVLNEIGLSRVILESKNFPIGVVNDSGIIAKEVKTNMKEYLLYGVPLKIPVDTSLVTSFQSKVFTGLEQATVRGNTISYGQLAEHLGNRKMARAVGTALAKNPLPLVYPCHRVINSDGRIGNFLGGKEMKEYLLGLERL